MIGAYTSRNQLKCPWPPTGTGLATIMALLATMNVLGGYLLLLSYLFSVSHAAINKEVLGFIEARKQGISGPDMSTLRGILEAYISSEEIPENPSASPEEQYKSYCKTNDCPAKAKRLRDVHFALTSVTALEEAKSTQRQLLGKVSDALKFVRVALATLVVESLNDMVANEEFKSLIDPETAADLRKLALDKLTKLYRRYGASRYFKGVYLKPSGPLYDNFDPIPEAANFINRPDKWTETCNSLANFKGNSGDSSTIRDLVDVMKVFLEAKGEWKMPADQPPQVDNPPPGGSGGGASPGDPPVSHPPPAGNNPLPAHPSTGLEAQRKTPWEELEEYVTNAQTMEATRAGKLPSLMERLLETFELPEKRLGRVGDYCQGHDCREAYAMITKLGELLSSVRPTVYTYAAYQTGIMRQIRALEFLGQECAGYVVRRLNYLAKEHLEDADSTSNPIKVLRSFPFTGEHPALYPLFCLADAGNEQCDYSYSYPLSRPENIWAAVRSESTEGLERLRAGFEGLGSPSAAPNVATEEPPALAIENYRKMVETIIQRFQTVDADFQKLSVAIKDQANNGARPQSNEPITNPHDSSGSIGDRDATKSRLGNANVGDSSLQNTSDDKSRKLWKLGKSELVAAVIVTLFGVFVISAYYLRTRKRRAESVSRRAIAA